MRDRKYIQNVVESVIGANLMRGLARQASNYSTLDLLWKDLRRLVESAVTPMSVETLGIIIEYSDPVFRTSQTATEHVVHPFNNESPEIASYISEGLVTGGKTALVRLATLTIVATAFDLMLREEETQRLIPKTLEGRFEQELYVYIKNWLACPFAGSNRRNHCSPLEMRRLGYRIFAITDSWGKTDIFFDPYIWRTKVKLAPRCPHSENVNVLSGETLIPTILECDLDTPLIVQQHMFAKHDAADWETSRTVPVTIPHVVKLLETN